MLNKIKEMARSKKNKKGFTLVELIVVIAVLAILAAIAVPNFAGFTGRANRASDDQLMALMVTAARTCFADDTFTFTTAQTAANTPATTITVTPVANPAAGASPLTYAPANITVAGTGNTVQAEMDAIVGMDQRTNRMKFYSSITITIDGFNTNRQSPTITVVGTP